MQVEAPELLSAMNPSEQNASAAPAPWRSRWYSAAIRGTVGVVAGTAFAAAVAFLFLSL